MDLSGRWIHAQEEDTGDELVWRPAGYPLPRARGRTELELRPDGTFVERYPGPDDRPAETTGRWSYEGDRLTLGADRTWTVTGLGPDRLTVKR
jgi:hypothetical protein